MIAILKHNTQAELVGWIIAVDMADATRQAWANGEQELSGWLYRNDFPEPSAGRHNLPQIAADGSTYTMLVT